MVRRTRLPIAVLLIDRRAETLRMEKERKDRYEGTN